MYDCTFCYIITQITNIIDTLFLEQSCDLKNLPALATRY